MSVSTDQESDPKPNKASPDRGPWLGRLGRPSLSVALLGLLVSMPGCAKDEASYPVEAQAQSAPPAVSDQTSAQEVEPDPFPGSSEEFHRDVDAAPVETLEDAPAVPGRGSSVPRFDDSTEMRKSKRRKKTSAKQKKRGSGSKSSKSPKAGERGPSERTRPATEPEPSISDPEQLIASLSSLEGQLRSAGVRLPQDTRADSGGAGRDGNESVLDCEKVCELRGTICALEVRICSLAQSHPEDDRYANACERAHGDCRVASSACGSCD